VTATLNDLRSKVLANGWKGSVPTDRSRTLDDRFQYQQPFVGDEGMTGDGRFPPFRR